MGTPFKISRNRSVSSVRTLEEAKVANGCLYFAPSVQEVRCVGSVILLLLTGLSVWYTSIWEVRGYRREGIQVCTQSSKKVEGGREIAGCCA